MIELTLNGEPVTFDGDDDLTLLTWLREDQGIPSPKNGCSGQGACGACMVEIDGKPSLACRTPMKSVRNARIVTIEGMDPDLKDILARAFVKKGAVQCGFCTPGFLSRTKLLLEHSLTPTRDQIRKALGANLCRCTGYTKIIDAVVLAAEAIREKKEIRFDRPCRRGQKPVQI